MYLGSIFLSCPQCQRKIRQFTKDFDRVDVRVCPACGTSVKAIARKFNRYKVKNAVCLLQVQDTPKTFSACVVDICEGGMQLELNINVDELGVCPPASSLKILGHSIKGIPFPLTQDTLNIVWQNKQAVGCSFVDPSQI